MIERKAALFRLYSTADQAAPRWDKLRARAGSSTISALSSGATGIDRAASSLSPTNAASSPNAARRRIG
jgi:hypothetical protein